MTNKYMVMQLISLVNRNYKLLVVSVYRIAEYIFESEFVERVVQFRTVLTSGEHRSTGVAVEEWMSGRD